MKCLKRTLKWTAAILGALMVIVLIANAVFVRTTDARLEQQLAAIRAAGDPLTLADLKPTPIPAEQNAATYLRQADAEVEAIVSTTTGVEVGKHIKGNNHSYLYPMPPNVQKIIRTALDAHSKAVPLLLKAVACPDYDPQLDYSVPVAPYLIAEMLPGVQNLRADMRVLQGRAWLLVAEGNYDEAMRMAIAMLRLSRHCDRYPALVGYLVALTVRSSAIDAANLVLQVGPVSKQLRDELDAELAIHESMEGYVRALKGARVFDVNAYGTYYTASGDNSVPFRHFWLIGRGMWNRRESEYLDKMAAVLALLREPPCYRKHAEIIGNVDYKTLFSGSEDPWDFFSGVRLTYPTAIITCANIRALRVLNALQTHVPAGSQETPKLTELGLPAETTSDPFNGEPLHVKKTSQGWLVYSVGVNCKDDGGKLDDAEDGDVGVGPLLAEKPAAKADEPGDSVPNTNTARP
jgi:hypothetical protein